MVIWLIGLSGAGKTAIGEDLQKTIRAAHKPCVLIDGDVIRTVFGNDLTHSLEDRAKNGRRICELGKFLDSQGINVVCSILSIFHEQQDWNRANVPNYFEVFVDVSLEATKARDVKGWYAKAARGELKDVVGVDLPFPPPKSPNLVLKNDYQQPISELSGKIYNLVCAELH